MWFAFGGETVGGCRLKAALGAVFAALALRLLFPALHDGAARLAERTAGAGGARARIETMGGGLTEYGLTDAIVCAFDAAWSGEAYPAGRICKGK